VHSAKDLPYDIPSGLKIGAITKGIDSRDVLVLGRGVSVKNFRDNPIKSLPEGFRVGTSSKRRSAQLSRINPGVIIKDIRGAVDDRIKQLDAGRYDAIIAAAAGLIRLGMRGRIDAYLDFDTAHLQGKLALEIRAQDREAQNAVSFIDDRKNWGKVYITGAGPGDPGLITVKGNRLLKTCDAVVYDSLSPVEMISDLKCEKICAGKRKGSHIMEQDEINSLLVRLSIGGKDTVRLKGGDPLIFGRGFEEAEYLRKHFIDYEIVPGITAALAASAYAEIPLTKRGFSSHVAFSSGHAGKNAYIPEAGKGGTSVYYMSASNVREIAGTMLDNGAPKALPAAVVSNASLANQRVYAGTLESFTAEGSYESPAVFITGAAAVKNGKSWFERKKKILFTGTNPGRYSHLGEIVNNPMIELKPVVKKISVSRLKKYRSIVFTSKHGVKFFFEALYKGGADARGLHDKKIFSIGSVTTGELINHGIRPDAQAAFETAEGLVEEFKRRKIKGQDILLPCSALSYDTLRNGLNAAGNRAEPFVIYKNVLPAGAEKKDLSNIDAVIFTAPSCVRNFRKIYGAIPERAEIITTGRITKEAAENEKIRQS